MNFLNGGGCLARYGLIKFGLTACCRDTFTPNIAPNPFVITGKSTKKLAPTGKTTLGVNNLCKCHLRLNLGPLLWTQIRCKNHPRFHNDLEFPNFDYYRKDKFKDPRKTTWGSGDEKPGYTYVLALVGMIAAAYGTKAQLIHYISVMAPAADVLALASIEVDISKIAEGACLSYKWRGKPLFIKHRTAADIAVERDTPMSALKDPETEEQRCTKPEWLIVIGICTHLGCVPVPNSGDFSGGFYCPCHGSHYDNIGRARKGPAPTNLEVPPYKFLTDTTVLVG